MSDELDLEKELAKSIANIVDEETSGAEAYVMNETFDDDLNSFDDDLDIDDDLEEEPEDNNKKTKHLIIAISVIAVVLVIIIVSAIFIVKAVYNKSQDNYAHYHNAGFTALENKEYNTAVENFEKALTYQEGKTNSDMMLYLYECYGQLNETDKAIDVLNDVLALKDKNYYNALYYLVKHYEEVKDYASVKDLYLENADSTNEDVIKLFKGYLASSPVASPLSDTYGADQKITLTAQTGCKIYYTVDGSDPTVAGIEYTGKIYVTEGTTRLRFYAVNEYGFESELVEEKYIIDYEAPIAPTIYPEKSTFEQINKVMVTINNYPADAKVYYTLDGTLPTEESDEYSGAFALPAGSTIVNVLVVDSHGLTCRTSKTYNVTYISSVTEADAIKQIWKELVTLGLVNNKHYNDKDELCELSYYSKKTIDDLTLYMYYFSIGGETMDYWFAADDEEGLVYYVTEADGEYTVVRAENVDFTTDEEENPSEDPSEDSSEDENEGDNGEDESESDTSNDEDESEGSTEPSNESTEE